MKHEDSHLSDQQLIKGIDCELSMEEIAQVEAHLATCEECRIRRQELEQANREFAQFHQELSGQLPDGASRRAQLRAELAHQSSSASYQKAIAHGTGWAWTAATCAFLSFGVLLVRNNAGRRNEPMHPVVISIPDSRLTPGATLLVSQRAVCSQANTKNKTVPSTVQREIFAEYGIPRADPRAYEVDYLVTPALGGADDIHNLWPHSTSEAVWTAPVKDALEDRLREMVCDGSLDLAEAQHEIAANWIAAYKKYFHTDRPIVER